MDKKQEEKKSEGAVDENTFAEVVPVIDIYAPEYDPPPYSENDPKKSLKDPKTKVVSKQPGGGRRSGSSYVRNDPFPSIMYNDPMNFGCCLAILGPICEPFCALCEKI